MAEILRKPYGTLPSGEQVDLFTLTNKQGMTVEIINYGGIITKILAPDREGQFADIVLGKPDLAGYVAGHPYFGAIVGRVAGRISYGRFSLEGKDYQLAVNDEPNHLHGGDVGFDKKLWQAEIIEDPKQPKLRLTATSPEGEEGYPGEVCLEVVYWLDEDNGLHIRYQAETDKTTPFNITNHSYFNLKGQGVGKITDHSVQVLGDQVATTDDELTLNGQRVPVQAGFNDYREPVLLSTREKLEPGNADIFYFMPDGRVDKPRLVARVSEASTGRVLETYTTEPGVQFYAGISLSVKGPDTGKAGQVHGLHEGFCLETQDYPDSVNYPDMGNAILRPGQRYSSETIYRFGTF